MRVAGTAPPDVAARIGRFGLYLRIELAGALARHRDLDPALPLEGGDHGAAPLLLHRAIEHEIAVRQGASRRQYRSEGGERRAGEREVVQHRRCSLARSITSVSLSSYGHPS